MRKYTDQPDQNRRNFLQAGVIGSWNAVHEIFSANIGK